MEHSFSLCILPAVLNKHYECKFYLCSVMSSKANLLESRNLKNNAD